MGFYCIGMVLNWIALGEVEICVILLIVAAAVLAAAMKPVRLQPVETAFATGCLQADSNPPSARPTLEVNVLADYSVVLTRHGLPPATSVAALAVTVKGSDISVEERLTESQPAAGADTLEATYLLTFLKPRTRYHLHFNSQSQSIHCAFTLLTEHGFNTTSSLHL